MTRSSVTILSRLVQEDPSGCADASALFFHSIAFSFIFLPFSPSINSLTSDSNLSLCTLLSISIPIPQ
ncbi:hypothetical protein ACHQM5_027117 [Ranunculus cassubicifolius]